MATDPLGAFNTILDVNQFPRWNAGDAPVYDIMVDDPENMRKSPFEWHNDINQKIILWNGDLTQLGVEAIINSTNESMTDKNPLTERIFNKAGIQLKNEIRNNIKTCRTGDAKLTKGYKLPARYVIHTVGPRYNIKYKTAAESALYNSYRSVLYLVKENQISTLGIPCIHTMRRGYPSHEGAHIAIRAVRRFLEKHGTSIETLVFVVAGEDLDVYQSLMPLYFPRSKSEEDFAAYHLPYDVGNDDGEPVIAERQIRIMGKPTIQPGSSNDSDEFPGVEEAKELDESININEVFDTSVAVGQHAFSKMEGDIDKQRKQKLQGRHVVHSNIAEQQKRYDRWLRKAKQEDLSMIEQLRCFYQSGFDKFGRPVIVFVGKYFNSQRVNLEKAAMFFIQTMDQVVSQPYIVVYLHTATEKHNQPDINFIKDIYNLVDQRYHRNLKAFYIVHPTFWSKVLTWFFTTFTLSDVKPKVQNIPGLEYLYTRIAPDQLDLPNFVLDHDMRVNGTRYYNPEEDQAIGSL